MSQSLVKSKRYTGTSKAPVAMGNPFGTSRNSIKSGSGGGTKRRKVSGRPGKSK